MWRFIIVSHLSHLIILLLSRPDGIFQFFLWSKSMELEIQCNNLKTNQNKNWDESQGEKTLFWLKCESKVKVIEEQLINELKSLRSRSPTPLKLPMLWILRSFICDVNHDWIMLLLPYNNALLLPLSYPTFTFTLYWSFFQSSAVVKSKGREGSRAGLTLRWFTMWPNELHPRWN